MNKKTPEKPISANTIETMINEENLVLSAASISLKK